MGNIYSELFDISPKVTRLSEQIEKNIQESINNIEKVKEYNQVKILKAMQNNKLSDTHFIETTGYGYNDRGREIIDSIYAEVFGTEDALVRGNITCGTHALSLCLYGILRPGDELLSIVGKPYDTLDDVIGIKKTTGKGSLYDFNISYRQVDLKEDGNIDVDKVLENINQKTKMIFLQRSRGYEWRDSITIKQMQDVFEKIKQKKSDICIMVDNCYGEFVDMLEPTQVGADIMAGSLIKNPGGGITPSGGYIVGKKEYVELVSCRHTTPSLSKEVGATLGSNRLILQGLFFAPHVVAESLKGAVFTAGLMEHLGFETCPSIHSYRGDIIQSIKFNDPEKVIAFCQGIQKGSPVDSYVSPEPWDMPGYDSKVIMAAGAFIQGSSIELSADAPIREPYVAYLQGGLVYESVKTGVLTAVNTMLEKGLLSI